MTLSVSTDKARSSPLSYVVPACTWFNRGESLEACGRRAACFRNSKRLLRVRYCMSRVTGVGGGGGCCHVCQGERRLRDMSLCQRLLKKIWRRLYASFAPSVFLKGWGCGWQMSDLKEDYHLLGDERQVEGAFLFSNVLFILSLIQEFLLLCEGKIFV
jgi:hypothetical protein